MSRGNLSQMALAGLCALLFVAQFQWRPVPLAVRFEILTESSTRFVLLYHSGSESSQQGRTSLIVSGSPSFQTIRFPVDQPLLNNFRLQQTHGASPYLIRRTTVERFGGASVAISPGRLKPFAGIENLIRQADAVEIWPSPGFLQSDLEIQPRKEIRETRLSARLAQLRIALLALASLALIWATARNPVVAPPAPCSPRGISIRNCIVSLLFAFYLAGSLLGFNGSATALWRLNADHQNPNDDLILGAAKFIRSDEWLVHTPWILSQCYQLPAFPLVNHDIGEGPAPLITSLPVRHWSMIFRPQYLGFFFLPLSPAFAFYWNFKWFVLLLGAFLFLEKITGGRSWLALAGAGFILFSGFVQWWFSSPTMMPEMIGTFFLALWATAIIFRSSSRWAALGAALCLLCAIEQFVFCCYPRFQIPLFYLGLFLLVAGAVRMARSPSPVTLSLRFRLSLFIITLLTGSLLLAVWSREIRPLLGEIRHLVYPGQVFYTGGNFLWFWFAAPFFEFAMTEEYFPKTTGNACEAAGYIFLLPLLLLLAAREARHRRFDPFLIASTAFAALLVYFMCIGVPVSVAQWSGLSFVAPTRANIALGLASIIALTRYLSRAETEPGSTFLSAHLVAFAAFALLCGWIFYEANFKLANYVSTTTVVVVSLYFALLALVIWKRQTVAVFTLLLAPLVCAYGLVNPISRGLPAFAGSPLWQTIREMHLYDPAARWLVLAPDGRSSSLAQFAKSTGAQVLGGARCNPDPEMIRLLDPAGNYRPVHSRYAHISFVPADEPAPRFELTSTDTYTVHLPMETDFIQGLGVRYLLEIDGTPLPRKIAGYEEVHSIGGIRILQAAVTPNE